MSKAKKIVSNQKLGEKLKQARKEAGYSQKELASVLKLSDKAVSSYEVGRAEPNLETLQAISQVTYKPVSYFLEDNHDEDLDLQIRLKRIEQELLAIKKALKKK